MSREVRGAAAAAPRATPLELVSGAVAGDSLERTAAQTAHALGCPVAIALQALSEPVVSPASARVPELDGQLLEQLESIARGEAGGNGAFAHAVPVRIGREVVGIVAALEEAQTPEQVQPWLTATAAAASVTALIQEAQWRGVAESRWSLRREAELLSELAEATDAALPEQEETYRLLIGIAIRAPEELERLRTRTVGPLLSYDAEHDTELLATLRVFLAHHGSTTDTAEAMGLHRHTVGYRLSRVQAVSGLSPYASDGRERLSLGLKAHEILRAWERVSK